jgi:hypothetical protein
VVRLLIRGKACLPSHPSDQSVPVFTDSTQLGYQLHKYCNQLTQRAAARPSEPWFLSTRQADPDPGESSTYAAHPDLFDVPSNVCLAWTRHIYELDVYELVGG